MKKNIKLLILLCMILSFVSCSNDFLVTAPVMSETSSTYYNTDGQMFNALMASYDVLSWCKEQGMGYRIPFSEVRSDNAKSGGGSSNDNAGSQASEEFTNDNSDDISYARWYWAYTGIYRCNLVIVKAAENSALFSDVVKGYVAEAKFLRAWYLFEVLNTFGPCPIVTDLRIPGDGKGEFTRATRDEVNAQIIKDLTESLVDIHKEKWGNGNVGRISEDIVRAFLGKVYLYQADWNNDDKATFNLAKEQFQKVVDNGNYQLMTNYRNIYGYQKRNYSGENNSESIFEIQRTSTSGINKGTGVHTDQFEGAYWLMYIGLRGMTGSNIYITGWGFMLPTQESQAYFTADDSIRLDAYTLTPKEVLASGTNAKWNIALYNAEDWNGCAAGKYTALKDYDIVGSQNFNLPGNERMIRLADVMLMLAECNLRGTSVNDQAAIDLINTERKAHLGGGTDKYLTVAQLKASDPLRFKTTLDVVWYERRCELAGEGDRWFDLVRTGRAPRVNAHYAGWDANDIYMPIFVNEITATGLSEYPETSDSKGLYPGVIDNTLETCRIN